MNNIPEIDTGQKPKLLKKVSIFINEGFQHLRMEDIAKLMNVSRATMYKYFSSKEEVIEGVVRVFTDYIERLEDRKPENNEESFGVLFQQLFEQSIMLVGKITEVFLLESQSVFPELNIILLQDNILLREIVGTKFLLSNQTTIRQGTDQV
ncbi:TetR/AcrR family transcriptional regulator [Bacillus sp. FJAT-26390]|uniref:TetR/AcrR family transcriptional regulator n=1 Tax=Bacillus sp. FJAT-26390 TaxID=1743142 RepID=UPI000807C968|nr:TetR/AcrR family transcriptional regulator [Bacillus sp. FJAT-26390]OBZ15770.1 hypothetical protein A7975_30440 [Bacillus sp. FJAT-26390]